MRDRGAIGVATHRDEGALAYRPRQSCMPRRVSGRPPVLPEPLALFAWTVPVPKAAKNQWVSRTASAADCLTGP